MVLEDLFVYGTLMDFELRKKLLGREINTIEDILNGYKKFEIKISKKTYPLLTQNGSESSVKGLIIKVSIEELRLLDEYEGKDYRREKIILKSGKEAWVYLSN